MAISSMMRNDVDRYNTWFQKAKDWVKTGLELAPEFAERFDNPTEYARAYAEHMLQSTDAQRYLTPGYRDFLLKVAPQAYALQAMMAPAHYGMVPGNDFAQFLVNWISPNYGGQPSRYGFGGLWPEAMKDVWGKFVNRYEQALQGGVSPELEGYLSNLSPSDLQAFHELALKSTLGPFAQQVMGRYLDKAYSAWTDFTKATPWIEFIKQIAPGTYGTRGLFS